MIVFLGPLLLFALYVVFVASLSRTAGDVGLWRKAASIAITVRLGIFWGLLAFHSRDALGLWAMPLLLLLLPEGFLSPARVRVDGTTCGVGHRVTRGWNGSVDGDRRRRCPRASPLIGVPVTALLK